MTANEYQKLALKYAPSTEYEEMIAHGSHGLAAEAGEVNGIFQKFFQGHPISHDHLLRECGDVLWMVTELLTATGYTLEECMIANIQKLENRYPDGFDPERSLHRKPGDI